MKKKVKEMKILDEYTIEELELERVKHVKLVEDLDNLADSIGPLSSFQFEQYSVARIAIMKMIERIDRLLFDKVGR